jgi:hypothetical protein
MILCGGSHEGSLLSYGFLLEGSFGPDLLVVSTQFLLPCPVIFVVMGLLGLISNNLVSLRIISLGYMGSFMLLMFAQLVMMDIIPRGFL